MFSEYLIDDLRFRLKIYLGEIFGKNTLTLLKMPSLAATCCKLQKIQSCEVVHFLHILYIFVLRLIMCFHSLQSKCPFLFQSFFIFSSKHHRISFQIPWHLCLSSFINLCICSAYITQSVLLECPGQLRAVGFRKMHEINNYVKLIC